MEVETYPKEIFNAGGIIKKIIIDLADNKLDRIVVNTEAMKNKVNEILEEIQDKEMQMKEFMLLGLRKIEGIRNQDFYNKFGIEVEEKFEVELKKLRKENLIEKDKIRLTNRGLDLANIVWEEFI